MQNSLFNEIPERIYEPNIIHNPFTWMGIWTPHGWRVHKMRFGKAELVTVTLSGDGKTTFFPEALLDPKTGKMGWQDDLHLKNDIFTDCGLYPADPRVEYPVGQPRWAISHTLLCYPVCDHGLYTHQYTWNMLHGHLQTHFRKHVALEEARTDSRDGKTVEVRHKPISTTIEGNVQYPMPNSAVRGVWGNPEKQGQNLYTKRIVQIMPMLNGVYAITPHVPVVQCNGVWAVHDNDPIEEVFDPDTGECTDRERLIEQFYIPLDEPKIGMIDPVFLRAPSRIYETEIGLVAQEYGAVDKNHFKQLQKRLGACFLPGKVGYAAKSQFADEFEEGKTYDTTFDYNEDGIIDEQDEQTLSKHLGRKVRCNLYRHAYFGGDWLTTVALTDLEHRQGTPLIADYQYGGGYDGPGGIINLQQTPGPDKPVWVEYHYDAPAEAGENNIRLHLYREER